MRRLAPLLLLATAAAARTTRAAKNVEPSQPALGLAIAGLATAIVALLVALTALGLAIAAFCMRRAESKPEGHGAAGGALSSSDADPGRVGSAAHKRD